MLNYNNPYDEKRLGGSVARCQINLSPWFKDSVYYPLGGNSHGLLRTYLNMILTMVISGIWHGANWTFVIWGAAHAFGRLFTRELERTRYYRESVPALVKQLLVFVFVMFTWIFFRARETLVPKMSALQSASLIIKRIFTTPWTDPHFPLVMLVMVLAVWTYQFLFFYSKTKPLLELAPVRIGLVLLMLAYLAIVAQPSTKAFIYFDF